jgi:hypothetical protein
MSKQLEKLAATTLPTGINGTIGYQLSLPTGIIAGGEVDALPEPEP